jgi:hypothetical protein
MGVAPTKEIDLSGIQQAFARRCLSGEIIGVRIRIRIRIRQLSGRKVLFVNVDAGRDHMDLPSRFRGLPVVVRVGERGVSAYA